MFPDTEPEMVPGTRVLVILVLIILVLAIWFLLFGSYHFVTNKQPYTIK